jgi:hypothetical protein
MLEAGAVEDLAAGILNLELGIMVVCVTAYGKYLHSFSRAT